MPTALGVTGAPLLDLLQPTITPSNSLPFSFFSFFPRLIAGFISKKDAETTLIMKPNGTFLLRFSDSEIGGISVAWVGEERQVGKKVWHLQPWFAKDLMIRPLADRFFFFFLAFFVFVLSEVIFFLSLTLQVERSPSTDTAKSVLQKG